MNLRTTNPPKPVEPPRPPGKPVEDPIDAEVQNEDQGQFVNIPIAASTQIASVDYNATTLDLIVRFQSGATYHYRNVDQASIAGWSSAQSPGIYFNQNVKNAGFDYERLD